MREAFLLLLQAVVGALPERIDLTLPVAAAGCAEPTGDDIVVCGGKASRHRLGKLAPQPEASLVPKAETGLLGGRAAIETEAAQMPGGGQSNRLMARMTLPF